VEAHSRGAMLIVSLTFCGFLMAISMAKRIQFVVLGAGLLVCLAIFVPEKFASLVYKQGLREQGVLFTREKVWSDSYKQAEKGGWFGGGYGVTIGELGEFDGGLDSYGYGREKGNSQLAIVEETGLIGLGLYVVSLLVLFTRLLRTFLRSPPGSFRAMMGITIGGVAGMLLGSAFEAWWVAPGSPESVYFWTLAGVALGLTSPKRVQYSNIAPRNTKQYVLPGAVSA
jgi:O-antigen ligase